MCDLFTLDFLKGLDPFLVLLVLDTRIKVGLLADLHHSSHFSLR